AVGDVGDLGFRGAVGEPDVGLAAPGLEEPPGQLGVLRRDAHAVGEVVDPLHLGVGPDRHHHLDGVAGGLRIGQLAEAHHFGARLLDPVTTGDAEIEEPLGHVERDLLRPQDAHVVDARVVDVGLVVDGGRPDDGEVGRLEQVERGLLQRSLRDDQPQHDWSVYGWTAVRPTWMRVSTTHAGYNGAVP